MARTNFEFDIYTHEAFPDLLLSVKNIYLVKGYLVHAFELAQKFWLKHHAVPREKWPSELDVLIDVGFARPESRDDGEFIYVAGSRERLSFLDDRSEAGKRGGIASGKKRKVKQDPELGSKTKQNEAKASKSKQTKQSHTNEPSLSIHMGSDEPAKAIAIAAGRPDRFIAGYCERFKTKYGINPDVTGKEAGIAKRVVEHLSAEKVESYLDAFFSLPDPWLIKRRHPMEAFEAKKNELAVFAKKGEFMTNRQAIQADSVSTNLALLQKVRGQR